MIKLLGQFGAKRQFCRLQAARPTTRRTACVKGGRNLPRSGMYKRFGAKRQRMKTYDFAVVGAGVFGAWTAHFLRKSGASVVLLDAYGPANSRASSGGETRVIRMGYGPDELYTRWAMRSLPLWREFAARTGREIFRQTGVLWLSDDADVYLNSLCSVLAQAGIEREELKAEDIARRWPQLRFHDVTRGVLEPNSGLLLAREAVQTLVKELVKSGVEYLSVAAEAPSGGGTLAQIKTGTGESISAGTFVFSCGPWLPKIFPALLAERIFPTRQEVFFLGAPVRKRGLPSTQNAGVAASHACRPALCITRH